MPILKQYFFFLMNANSLTYIWIKCGFERLVRIHLLHCFYGKLDSAFKTILAHKL